MPVNNEEVATPCEGTNYQVSDISLPRIGASENWKVLTLTNRYLYTVLGT